MSQFSEQITEKIDLHLRGELSPIENTQFETEVASNPELAQEVDLQKQIINSIKENRTLELKSRLSSIEVSSKAKWMSKTFFGGVAATVVLGIAGFTYHQYTKNNNNPDVTANDVQFIRQYDKVDNAIEEVAINTVDLTPTENNNITTSSVDNNTSEESVDYNNISAPDIDLNTNEESNVSTNSLATLDDLESVEIMNSGAVNVEIEFKNPNSKKLAYKFYDQKLYLFGKFNTKNPYEVIEINTKFGKEFYLKFDKSYYTIKNGIIDKTPLVRVTNDKLVQKLNNLN